MTNPSPIPAPLAPLEYSYATQRGRPGIITAIGVMSIVVACLSGLGSLWGAFSGVSYYMMSQMPPAAFTPPPPPATTAPTTVGSATTSTSIVHSSYSVTVIPGPGGTTTTAATAPALMGNPFGNISPVAAILSIVANVLSLGLAIFLLVAGIQTLRDSPSGAKLHWWYAVLKIPLVIFATGVGFWLTSSMMSGVMAATPAGAGGAGAGVPAQQMGFMWGFMLVSAIIPALFALAYPVALIFVLRSRSVRDYYNTVRA